MKDPEIKTYGCRLNFYESEVIRKYAKDNNLQNHIFINSCAVTNKTIADLKNEIRKVKKENQQSQVVLTGCAAQIHKKDFEAMSEVDSIIGNKEKLESSTYKTIRESNEPVNLVGDIFENAQAISPIINKVKNRIRGFVQIQNGCDHRCTFCIIPFGRGPSRSVSTQDVINSINSLLKNGVKEIVLTGVDLTSWGIDIFGKPSLGLLVKKILKNIPNLHRLRLSSIDPAEVDFDLMDAFEHEERLMPHIHLSIQHGDDIILKRMKRRHLYRDVINFVKEAKRRRNDIVFGGDFIAGFPKLFLHDSSLEASCAFSLRSAPAEKLAPSPVKITTLVSKSCLKCSCSSQNSLRTSMLKAFMDFGRLILTIEIESSFSIFRYFILVFCQIFFSIESGHTS